MKSLVATLLTTFCLVGVVSSPPKAEAARGPKGKNPDNLTNPTAEAIFKYLDKDEDKQITVKELQDVKTGDEAKESDARFKKWDTDNNGTLTLDEYKAGVASTPLPKREKKPIKKKPPKDPAKKKPPKDPVKAKK